MTENNTVSTVSAATLTPATIAKAFAALKKNDEAARARVKTTRTSLKPENRHNIDAMLMHIEGQLLLGNPLIIPHVIYKDTIEQLRALGFYEEAIENIYESKYLPAI